MGRPPTWRRPGPRRLLLTLAAGPARRELLAPRRPSRARPSPAGALAPLAPPTPAAAQRRSRRDSAAEAATAPHGRPARIPARPRRACVAEPPGERGPEGGSGRGRARAWPMRSPRRPVRGHIDNWQSPGKPRDALSTCEWERPEGRKGSKPQSGAWRPPIRLHSGREQVHRPLGKSPLACPGARVGARRAV